MTSFDYGSVMHYEWNAFAINYTQPTIIPIKNATAFIGQRIQLSPIDILEIQRYYDCLPTPTSTQSTTTTTISTSTTTETESTTVTVTATQSITTTTTENSAARVQFISLIFILPALL